MRYNEIRNYRSNRRKKVEGTQVNKSEENRSVLQIVDDNPAIDTGAFMYYNEIAFVN
jgi:hypothetical protein